MFRSKAIRHVAGHCRGTTRDVTVLRWGRHCSSTPQRPEPVAQPPQLSHPHAKGFAIGLTTGLLGSMAGIGGGPFCVPLLAGAGLGHLQCVGTSLVCATTTLVFGGATTVAFSTVHISLLPALVLGGVAPVFSYVGSHYTKAAHPDTLKRVFAVFLVLSSCAIFFRVYKSKVGTGDERHFFAELVSESKQVECAFYTMVAAVAGLASGTLGLGGGSVVVPILSLADVASWQVITGTALIAMIPTSGVALMGHLRLGTVVRSLVPSLVTGTCAGAVAGPIAMTLVEEDMRKTVCATIIATTGIYMLLW